MGAEMITVLSADIIHMICYTAELCCCLCVCYECWRSLFWFFGCWWFSRRSIDYSKYLSWPVSLKNQMLQACTLSYLTAVGMLMNLKKDMFRYGELLPSNNACRTGVLRDETNGICISSLGENKIALKSIFQHRYHNPKPGLPSCTSRPYRWLLF